MDALGLSLIVGGMALLFSGLIFLLPFARKQSSSNVTIEENIERIEYYLHQVRRDRE